MKLDNAKVKFRLKLNGYLFEQLSLAARNAGKTRAELVLSFFSHGCNAPRARGMENQRVKNRCVRCSAPKASSAENQRMKNRFAGCNAPRGKTTVSANVFNGHEVQCTERSNRNGGAE